MKNALISFKNFIMCPPKINRMDFFIRILFWGVAMPFIAPQIIAVISNLFGKAPSWVNGLNSILILIGLVCACIARLQDLSMSKWQLISLFIPIYGWIVIFKLLFKVGDTELNIVMNDSSGLSENKCANPLEITHGA